MQTGFILRLRSYFSSNALDILPTSPRARHGHVVVFFLCDSAPVSYLSTAGVDFIEIVSRTSRLGFGVSVVRSPSSVGMGFSLSMT